MRSRKEKIELITKIVRGEVAIEDLRPKSFTLIAHQDKPIEYRAEGQPVTSSTFYRDLYSTIGRPLSFQIQTP